MAGRTRAARQGYVWEDMVRGSRHIVNNEDGSHVLVDRVGQVSPLCRVGVSGVADTRERLLDFKTKGDVLKEALRRGPEPARPGMLTVALRAERVETKGRYRLRPVSESELWVRETRMQRSLDPERVQAERAADDKFRRKVEEAHRNYRALEKQLGPKAGGIGGFEPAPPRRVTREDLEPFMHMKKEDAMPVNGNMDPFGLYRP